MVENLAPFRTQLHANHASNYLTLSGRLPKDRDQILSALDAAIADTLPLKPETLRML
jgi:hypothetical protein